MTAPCPLALLNLILADVVVVPSTVRLNVFVVGIIGVACSKLWQLPLVVFFNIFVFIKVRLNISLSSREGVFFIGSMGWKVQALRVH
jgi:hypothetical protein